MSTEASSEDVNFNLAEEWLRTAELQMQNPHVAAAPAAALSLFPSSQDQQSPYNFSPLEASESAAASGFGEELLDLPSHGVGSMISAAASSPLNAATATSADLMMPIVKSDPSSSSSSSSYKNSSSSSQALDLSTRDLCKKVTLNEAMMHQAIEKLGGGETGLKILMDHVRFWVGQRISSNCGNTTADQHISISDSLKQLCSIPPAAATTSTTAYTTSPAANPMSMSPACCSLQSYCASGDLETTAAGAASFYGAQPRSQAPKPRCQQQQQQQQQVQEQAVAWLNDHEMQNPKKPRRTVACSAMGFAGMDSFVHTGSAHMSFRSGAREQFWDTVPLRARLHHDKRSSAASWNYVSAQSAAATRAARKHRLACQRLSKSYGALATAASSYNGSSKSNSSSRSLAMHQQQPDDDSPLAVEKLPLLSHVAKKIHEPITMSSSGVNKLQSSGNPFISNRHKGTGTGTLVMLLHKLLQPSDVSSLGRIVLPKKEAESCLPYLAVKEGMLLTMEDFYTGKTWKVRYRYWPNNRSRMYLIENTGVFVRSHQLQEGDLLILYRNVEHDRIVIRGKKNAQPAEGIVPAVTDRNLAPMTKDSKAPAPMTKDSKAPAMPIPRLDTKQRVVMKQGGETVDHDQTNSQLKSKLHCAISAAFETAANFHKVDWAQFEDPSELGNLMQGLIHDDKQCGTCGLAGGKNPEQLVSFPSLEFGDLLMEDDVAQVPCDFNLPGSTCKIEQE